MGDKNSKKQSIEGDTVSWDIVYTFSFFFFFFFFFWSWNSFPWLKMIFSFLGKHLAVSLLALGKWSEIHFTWGLGHLIYFLVYKVCLRYNYGLTILFFKIFFVYLFLRDRERQSTSREGVEREGDTESETGSKLRSASTESYARLELTNREIMTSAEFGCLTD